MNSKYLEYDMIYLGKTTKFPNFPILLNLLTTMNQYFGNLSKEDK